MKRSTTIWLSAIMGLLLLSSLFAWGMFLEQRRANMYGATPLLGGAIVDHATDKDRWCYEIQAIVPRVRYNWFGEMWREPHVLWEDVEVTTIEGRLDPGHTGPVELGDLVCSWPESSWIHFRHIPTGQRLTAIGTL